MLRFKLILDKNALAQLSKSDGEYLNSLKLHPLAFIICSQTYNGKSRFVNQLLNEPILPESPIINQNDVVRMIRIKVEIPLRCFVFFRFKSSLRSQGQLVTIFKD